MQIKWEGGGEVPAELSGMYTTPFAAKIAIDSWQAVNREEPVVVKVKREEDEAKARAKAAGFVKPAPQSI